jgi:hypothetical protein
MSNGMNVPAWRRASQIVKPEIVDTHFLADAQANLAASASLCPGYFQSGLVPVCAKLTTRLFPFVVKLKSRVSGAWPED